MDQIKTFEILDLLAEYLILLDEKCNIIFINKTFREAFLKNHDNSIKKPYSEIQALFFYKNNFIVSAVSFYCGFEYLGSVINVESVRVRRNATTSLCSSSFSKIPFATRGSTVGPFCTPFT
mgnify:CR=1 FL=1